MPAVNPARLQAQIDQLMKSFDAPKAFHQRLRDIFELYANRTLRMGEFPPYPLIPMYHLPDMVTRQVEVELKPNIFENPVTAIAIADELWMDEFYEIRHITSFILGVVEMENPEPIHTRLKNWLTPDLDKTLTSDLLAFGTHSLQTNFPVVWEEFIEAFLTQKDPKMIGLGLQGLNSSLEVHSDLLLPSIFRLIRPLIQDVDLALSKDLEQLIRALVSISPTETAFYLKQAMSISDTKGTTHLVKQCLSFFDEDLQQELKASMR